MNLIPIIKLRNFYKTKLTSRKKNDELILTENNKSVKGRKINNSIICHFDKKIKITDSINLTEKLRQKKVESKLENYKLYSIISKKKKFIPEYLVSENKKRKKIIEHNEEEKYIFLERLLTPKNIKLSTLLLTDKSINLTNKNSHFQKNIQKILSTTKYKENKRDRIEEILKEKAYSHNISNVDNEIEKINVFKRDNNYKKNLIRLRMFYGFHKK